MKKILVVLSKKNEHCKDVISTSLSKYDTSFLVVENESLSDFFPNSYDGYIFDNDLSNTSKTILVKKCDFYASVRIFNNINKNINLVSNLVNLNGNMAKDNGMQTATDIIKYTDLIIEKVARVAYELPNTSTMLNIDNAGMFYSSNLWRKIINDINEDYPSICRIDSSISDISYSIKQGNFNTILTEGLFENVAIKTLLFNGYLMDYHYLESDFPYIGYILYCKNLEHCLKKIHF